MTEEQIVHMVIQNHIKNLPFDQQLAVNDCALKLREIINQYNVELPLGSIALSLVGAEFAAEE